MRKCGLFFVLFLGVCCSPIAFAKVHSAHGTVDRTQTDRVQNWNYKELSASSLVSASRYPFAAISEAGEIVYMDSVDAVNLGEMRRRMIEMRVAKSRSAHDRRAREERMKK
jgi:hypothetical protein